MTLPTDLAALCAAIGPLDERAMVAARDRLDRLTKPAGSLGRLEVLAAQLSGITGRVDAPVAPATVLIFAADHGVARRGVSAYPPEVTAQMVANFVAGGAAINQLARTVGASVTVVDVGVAGPIPGAAPGEPGDARRGARLVRARVADGTADLAAGPAMTPGEVLAALRVGASAAADAIAAGARCLAVGEMGIGNTTAASAIVAVMTGTAPDAVTGRGTGLDDDGRRRKVDVIEAALARHGPDPADPLGVLGAVGGLEIAALTGCLLGAAAGRIPVVLDGFITAAAAVVAAALAPQLSARLLAGHRSVEPGHALALRHLGLEPILDLGLRLGEGTGAALALGILQAAVAARDGMATFEAAAVSGRSTP